jgi:hypothetical protein
MDWLTANGRSLRLSLNSWHSNEYRNELKVSPVNPHKVRVDAVPSLSSCLLLFSQLDVCARWQSEFKIFDRVYIQSRFQIRSFPYLASLRKVRQLCKKFITLDLTGVSAGIALTRLSTTQILTNPSFQSLQWRFLAGHALLVEIDAQCKSLVALLTQELSTGVFLHFPVVFISLASSIACLSQEFANEAALVFCTLRTVGHFRLIEFPEDPTLRFPELPWDQSFERPLPTASVGPLVSVRPVAAKIDFQITGRPQTQLRNKPAPVQARPKSALDSLGF